MEKTLELIFTKSDGAKKTLSIADPREDVTLAEAQAAAAPYRQRLRRAQPQNCRLYSAQPSRSSKQAC